MAEEEAISEEELSLFLWQKAAFMDTESGGRATADSLRLRLGQLEYAYWKEKSSGNSTLHVEHLMESYLKSYGCAIDDSQGLDNFAAPVQALTTGRKNESREWKSQLTFESAMEMPEIKALMKKNEFKQKSVNIAERSMVRQQSTTSGAAVQQPPPPPHGVMRKHAAGNSFPYPHPSIPPSSNSSASCSQFQSDAKRDGVQFNKIGGAEYSRVGRREVEGGPRKKPRVDVYSRVSAREEEEVECSDEKPPSAFVTARDQHVINQRKKFGGGGAASDNRQVSGSNYGQSKRSLGTRRVPSSKFVPPVKRDQDDELCEEITRRVFRGSNSGGGSGEGSKLPPELEGDERLKNIEPRMVEVIMNEIMDHGVPIQWDDIAGLQFAKATIKEIVVWPMLRPDIFTGLRGPPKGILLFGPPGTGKTLIGKCIASQVKATFFSISASSLTSKWIGEGEKMMRALFAVARCFQPAVIFIDEIDSLLTQRSDTEHESSRRIKTEFLVQLDGATTDSNDRLLVIGATNRPQEIDEAARRRLVKRLYIPLPDEAARRHIITNLMKGQSFSMSEEELDATSKQSDGYSGSDMANLCREAAYGPVREAAESIQHISADEMRPILHRDFEAAFKIIKPSVSEKDLGLYVEWNRQFGCGGM